MAGATPAPAPFDSPGRGARLALEPPAVVPGTLDGWTEDFVGRMKAAAAGFRLPAPVMPTPAPTRVYADGDPNLIPTFERADRSKVQQALVAQLLSTNLPRPAGEQPVAYFLAGGIGVGKIAFANRLYAQEALPSNLVRSDPDSLHSKIPEYAQLTAAGEGRATSIVHEEATLVARQAFKEALENRQDVLLNSMMAQDSSLERLTQAREAGFRVVVVGLVAPVEVAAARVAGSGVIIPADEIAASHAGFQERIDEVSRRSDSFVLLENTGTEVKLLASGSGGRYRVDEPAAFARVHPGAPAVAWL